jgi:hypothetical protein
MPVAILDVEIAVPVGLIANIPRDLHALGLEFGTQ